MFAFLLFISYKSLDQLHNSLSSCYFKCNWINKEFFNTPDRQINVCMYVEKILFREFVNLTLQNYLFIVEV